MNNLNLECTSFQLRLECCHRNYVNARQLVKLCKEMKDLEKWSYKKKTTEGSLQPMCLPHNFCVFSFKIHLGISEDSSIGIEISLSVMGNGKMYSFKQK